MKHRRLSALSLSAFLAFAAPGNSTTIGPCEGSQCWEGITYTITISNGEVTILFEKGGDSHTSDPFPASGRDAVSHYGITVSPCSGTWNGVGPNCQTTCVNCP